MGIVISGADEGAEPSLGYVTTVDSGKGSKAHPVTAQEFTTTDPLTVSGNEG